MACKFVFYFRLLQAAEEYHLPKSVKAEHGGGLKEFVVADSACYSSHDDEVGFFTTQERQWLVLKLLHNLRAGMVCNLIRRIDFIKVFFSLVYQLRHTAYKNQEVKLTGSLR